MRHPRVAARVVHLFDLDGAIGLAHLADELDVDAVVLTGPLPIWARSSASTGRSRPPRG
jgi:hypothetical protein